MLIYHMARVRAALGGRRVSRFASHLRSALQARVSGCALTIWQACAYHLAGVRAQR